MLTLYDFSVNFAKEPLLVPAESLSFGWKLSSDKTDVLQKSYRIIIKSTDDDTVADSGEVMSSKPFDNHIEGLHLNSCSDYTVELTVTDSTGSTACLTHPITTEILPEDWADAQWIKPAHHITGWAPYMRTKFKVGKIKKAVMYACGLGCAEYYINGKRADKGYIDPPMTNYRQQIFYRRFDVTHLINEGGNALGVMLGEGFYAQSRVWGVKGKVYGDVCAKIKLFLYMADGSVQTVVTDRDNWQYKYSPITLNNIYGGETYDARLETPDFALFDGSDEGWGSVTLDTAKKGALTPCLMPEVEVVRTLPATEHHGASGVCDGAWVFDIGENIAGVATFKLPPSPRGAIYVFRYAEALNAQGGIDHRSTGAFATQLIQQDMYICRGDEQGEIYTPRFCYHGFRYVEVTGIHDYSKGYGTVPELSIVTGLQLATNIKKIGEFHTDFEPLNQLDKLMHNTFLSNFHGFPEDCPAREKCGWTGDAQIVANWGLLSYDSAASYKKYLDDIRTKKADIGDWSDITPGMRGGGNATSLWGCAQIIIPYYLYKYWGDSRAVTDNFDLMAGWIDHQLARADGYIVTEGRGDWLPPVTNNSPRRMPVEHSSTFILYEQCKMMSELCRDLNIGDSQKYDRLAQSIKKAATERFYDKSAHSYGYWGSDGVALEIGLYPEGEKEALTDALSRQIIADDYAMPTAIYGNKYLVPALFEAGKGDLALEFLFGTGHISFGTMLNDGATSIWEKLEMHSVESPEKRVNSYNHPMHGGFLYACYTHLAGIRPLSAGFKEFVFKPCFVKGVNKVSAALDTACGKISVDIKGSRCSLTVPTGTRCQVAIEGEVTVNGTPYEKGSLLGSGQYEITW